MSEIQCYHCLEEYIRKLFANEVVPCLLPAVSESFALFLMAQSLGIMRNFMAMLVRVNHLVLCLAYLRFLNSKRTDLRRVFDIMLLCILFVGDNVFNCAFMRAASDRCEYVIIRLNSLRVLVLDFGRHGFLFRAFQRLINVMDIVCVNQDW